MIELYDANCAGLIPPCWQEFHYLIAGAWIGFMLALPFWVGLYRRWS